MILSDEKLYSNILLNKLAQLLQDYHVEHNITQYDSNKYRCRFIQYEIGNVKVVNNIRIFIVNETKYAIDIKKTITILYHSYQCQTGELLEIENDIEEECNEFLQVVKQEIDMPFLVFFSYFDKNNLMEEFFYNDLSILVSEHLPFPEYKEPDLKDYCEHIKTICNFTPNDFIITEGLENYFDNNYVYSFSSINKVNYKSKDYLQYIKNSSENIKAFCEVSESKYKETKNEVFYNNYIVGKFLLNESIKSDFYILLHFLEYYNKNEELPEDSSFFLNKEYKGKQLEVFNILKQIYIIQLCREFDDNKMNTIASLLNSVKIDETVKFYFCLIKYGPGIPDSDRYISPTIHKKYPLKRAIYNYLTVLKNVYEQSDGNYYRQINNIIDKHATKDNISSLSDDEKFNLGLYFYIFRDFEKAKQIFENLLDCKYNMSECAEILNKISVCQKEKDSLIKIGIDDKNKSIVVEFDIYKAAFHQLCQEINYEEIRLSVIANWKLLTKNKK